MIFDHSFYWKQHQGEEREVISILVRAMTGTTVGNSSKKSVKTKATPAIELPVYELGL
jgi:hypothetical protein